MKLEEDHVTSLELSVKLKEIGIEQKSFFVWEYYDDQCNAVKFIPYAILPDEYNKFKIYSAFLATELLEILPNRITIKENKPFNNFILEISKSIIVKNAKDLLDREKHPDPVALEEIEYVNIFILNYYCDSTEFEGENAWFKRKLIPHNIHDINLSNALAKVIIYLIENGLMETNS